MSFGAKMKAKSLMFRIPWGRDHKLTSMYRSRQNLAVRSTVLSTQVLVVKLPANIFASRPRPRLRLDQDHNFELRSRDKGQDFWPMTQHQEQDL